MMDTPQTIAYNGSIALVLLVLGTPVVATMLLALWLGPSRWPAPIRAAWERLPERYRTVALRIAYTPMTWLVVGIFVGASLINPLARWLRAMLP